MHRDMLKPLRQYAADANKELSVQRLLMILAILRITVQFTFPISITISRTLKSHCIWAQWLKFL